ncbi:hypothetical protein SAMN05216249_12228 [Acetitomaculum ruminis DSM 5522]|uniref:Uncharacterized protein n=1 Tax=Acetitomaculum ruminis DSM 5522 TaxID=1120918 RepID=A0A1I1A7K3_9FIRM|nr:hypothetical protein [Acetitomaculum ruminis]SFB33994.1 hypothetical protein SAMN05216249_12228 [Acetitomaculum ruminis DSM 5522]
MFADNMRVGDKLKKGYNLIEEGKIEGAYIFFEAVRDMYLYDMIEDTIFEKMSAYIRSLDFTKKPEPGKNWLKMILIDLRYAKMVSLKGDLLENICDVLNKLPIVEENALTQNLLEGSLEKVKLADGAYYTIQSNYESNQRFLIRFKDGQISPLDFDVKDFEINRQDDRIEFSYTRGMKDTFSIKMEGGDKKKVDKKGNTKTLIKIEGHHHDHDHNHEHHDHE